MEYMYPDTIVALLSEVVMAHVSPDPHGLSDTLEALAAFLQRGAARPPARGCVVDTGPSAPHLRSSHCPSGAAAAGGACVAVRGRGTAPYFLAVASRVVAYIFGAALKMLFVKRPGALPGAEPEQLLKMSTSRHLIHNAAVSVGLVPKTQAVALEPSDGPSPGPNGRAALQSLMTLDRGVGRHRSFS